jgi:hypothetical protein
MVSKAALPGSEPGAQRPEQLHQTQNLVESEYLLMTNQDLELLVTIDDTGEDEVPEIFNHQTLQGCTHLSESQKANSNGCEECLAFGDA